MLPEILFILTLSLITFFFITKNNKSNQPFNPLLPKSYPLLGSCFALNKNLHRRVQWTANILQNSPTSTFIFHGPLFKKAIFTSNPQNVEHILKTNFHTYVKGHEFTQGNFDMLGNGIFNVNGDSWKFQRQVASHEFNTKSLRKFVETVVDTEVNDRLIPILSAAAEKESHLDLQDILQRFAFDNICKIAFDYDPGCLLPSLPEAKFQKAFDEGLKLSSGRINSMIPLIWKIQKYFGSKSAKRLEEAVNEVRGFAKTVLKEKREAVEKNSSLESVDLLSRFLSSGQHDDNFIVDIVISFLLAGRDTTSAALTWFFWLVYKNPQVEKEILKEIREKSDSPIYKEIKDMVYTHASLCESMRLYPPVPTDSKVAIRDDVLPDGTEVKMGTRVTYNVYAMGRLEKLWGKDWAKFKPERWLRRDGEDEKWGFVGRDSYTYPVFNAGPRICLGKEMAFLQMKRVVAGVLSKFKIVPVEGEAFDPAFVTYLTSKMEGGFPIRVEKRN